MNTIFEGYHSSLPFYIYLILFIIMSAIAWWSYKDLKSKSGLIRYVLISLRSLVFFVLILLLLNPVFNKRTEKKLKPTIAVLLDNSKSMSIHKGDYNGKDSYKNVLNELGLHDSSDVHYDIWGFDRNIYSINPDSLKLTGSETNLSDAFQKIGQSNRTYKAVIILTDGIFTIGRDPTYQASHLKSPLFTIGMGDTVHLNDVVLQNIQVNEKTYLNTITPVHVTVLNDGYPNKNISVELLHNNNIIDSKVIHTTGDKSSHTLQFNIKPDKTGIQQYEINIPELKGEWTGENNKKVINLDVLNNKIKILDLAFEIHPDVKTIRSILEVDKSIDLYNRTWLGGKNMIGGNIPTQVDSLDLVILQGFPNKKMSPAFKEKIYNLIKDKPTLFVTTPQTDQKGLSTLLKGQVPIIFHRNNRGYEVRPAIDPNQKDHAILDLPAIKYDQLPEIKTPLRNAEPALGSKVLYTATYHDSPVNTPLLAVRTIGNKRTSEINFYNFYKWYQDPNGNTRDYITSLINNMVKWTSSSPDTRLLKVAPVNKVFSGSEDAILTGILQNESGDPDDKARIEVTLTNQNGEKRTYTMNNHGSGQYRLNFGKLPEGIYQYEAEAQKNTVTIDTQKGQFSVGSISAEFINTTRNDAMLKLISKSTGGEYFPFNKASGIREAIRQKGVLNPDIKSIDKRFYLYRSPWWFIVVLLLLTSEWGIRKYLALP
ncbi:MAG TPA: vWA domain-containing protein [Balneolales bacterium]|nr:vWA domain-containing protein [Balneolales bacterium]